MGDENDNKCDHFLESPYFIQIGFSNCVENCGPYYASDSVNNLCNNCANDFKFHIENELSCSNSININNVRNVTQRETTLIIIAFLLIIRKTNSLHNV